MRERVVITGIGCISSFGIGPAAFAEALADGSTGIGPVTTFSTDLCRSHNAAMITGFDPAAFIPPLKLRRIDGVGRLAIASARLLFDDARRPTPWDEGSCDQVGVALGTFTAGLDSAVEYLDGLTAHGPTGVPALIFSNTVSNAPASLCAIEFGLRGPNVTFNQREASSLAAVVYAVGAVRDRRVQAMVTGGADRLEETFFKVHDQFRALSPMRGESGAEAARPFDRRHNGFVLGEGGFLLLLESLSGARSRGARIRGEVIGVGVTASRAPLNGWPEEPAGLARAMRVALGDAGCAPSMVSTIVAAANGSPRLDRLEAAAIREVFSAEVPVTSVKGAIGESGAAGAGGVIAALLSVSDGVVPPTAGFSELDPESRVSVSAQPQASAGEIVVINSVASGGTNCSIIVRVSSAA